MTVQEDFDQILTTLKTGKWHLVHFFGFGLASILTAPSTLGGAFLTPNVDYVCDPPEELNVAEISNCSYITGGTDDYSKEVHQCSTWKFDNTTFTSTMTSEFELTCSDSYLRATFQTAYMIGNFFGSPLNGILSDKIGRRTTVMIGSIIFVPCSILSSWMPSFATVLSLRLVLGLVHTALMQTGYILCMEISEKKIRGTVGIVLSLPWALGTVYWGLLGYLIRDWRILQVACSLPGFIIIVFLWFYDESPRWLIVRGKHEQALKVLTKAARWNKVVLPPKEKLLQLMSRIQESSSEANCNSTTKDLVLAKAKTCVKDKIKYVLKQMIVLFSTPAIRRRTLLIYLDFIVASTVYYGLSLNGKNFSADPHIYMILTGVMEIPAYTLTVPIVAKFGRRIPSSLCYFLCGCIILILAFIPAEPTWLIIAMAMVGKMCISAAYQIVYLISSEIFPTEVRLQGIGTSTMVARIGATSAFFITDLLGSLYPWAPSMVFGGASIVGTFVTLLLPETLMKPLPETIAQLEAPESSTSTTESSKEEVINITSL